MTSSKIAIIGLGHWGRNLLRVFNQPGVLEAVFDLDKRIKKNNSIFSKLALFYPWRLFLGIKRKLQNII